MFIISILYFYFNMLYDIGKFDVLAAESMKIPPKRQYPPIKLRVLAAQNNKILIILNSFSLSFCSISLSLLFFFSLLFFIFFVLHFFPMIFLFSFPSSRHSSSAAHNLSVTSIPLFPLYSLFLFYFFLCSLLYLVPLTFLVLLFLFKYSGQHSCDFSVWKGYTHAPINLLCTVRYSVLCGTDPYFRVLHCRNVWEMLSCRGLVIFWPSVHRVLNVFSMI